MKYIILILALLVVSCLNKEEAKIANNFLSQECLDYELYRFSRDSKINSEEGFAKCLCKDNIWYEEGLRCGNKLCTWTESIPCNNNKVDLPHINQSSTIQNIQTKIETLYVDKKDAWEF